MVNMEVESSSTMDYRSSTTVIEDISLDDMDTLAENAAMMLLCPVCRGVLVNYVIPLITCPCGARFATTYGVDHYNARVDSIWAEHAKECCSILSGVVIFERLYFDCNRCTYFEALEPL